MWIWYDKKHNATSGTRGNPGTQEGVSIEEGNIEMSLL